MSVNVNRNVTDQFYRYKMPKIVAKVEGKGNGIKTVIVNMSDVAKALARPAEYTCKYFGCELGAQTQMDAKNDRYIVNGVHDANKLQNLLDGFISRFVLCNQCDNPETDLLIDKQQCIHQNCIACGHRGMVDMRHKLTTYIIKNPTEQMMGSSGGKKQKKDKKERRKEKQEREKNGTTPDRDLSPSGSADRGVPKESRRQSEIDGDWSVDTSESAVRARRQQLEQDLGSTVKSMTLSDAADLPLNERLDMFFEYVKGKHSVKEIFDKAVELDIKDRAVGILVEVYFNEDILSQIPKHRNLFLRFTNDSKKAQKYFMGAFERLVGIAYPSLLPKTANILMVFYDNDYVDEEVMLQWGTKVSSKYVPKEVSGQILKKAEPFLTWLATAEEEESTDDDDDVQVVYDDKADVSVNRVTPAAASAAADEDEEEIDIDDI
eukprot:Nk52_evm12s745 gene=Nk52_evmTU12s745